MATVTVSTNPYTTNNTLAVTFTTNATNITDIQLTNDGTNYISATSFTSNSAIFDVSSWNSGTYGSCYLKVIYTETSSGGGSESGGTTSEISNSFGALLKSSSTWYVIGDSISDTALIPQRKYMTVLGEAFPNITITNVGKDGSHFTNKTTGYSTFASLLDKLPSTTPNVVTVFGGVNDFIQNCSIGTISSANTTDFYGALNSFVSAAKSKYPSAEIIFIIPLNMTPGVFSTNSDGTNSIGNTLQNYRDAIKNVCANNNIKVIDLHEDSELQPNLITSDGLHPNQDGHALLATKLRTSMPSVPSSSGGGSAGGETGGETGGGDSGGGDEPQGSLLYSLPSETTFTGSNYIDTGVQLLASDTDWTIFIDYEPDSLDSNTKQLFGCSTRSVDGESLGLYVYMNSQNVFISGGMFDFAVRLNDGTGDMARRKISIRKSGSNIIINHDTTNTWDIENGYTTSITYSSHTASLLLGVDNTLPGTFKEYFMGTIYQCEVYSEALSDSEVATLLGNSTTTNTYTTAVVGDFSTVGNCSGIAIDSSNNLTASTLGQWGMVKLDKTVTKLKFTARSSQADYGALCWYIYNNNGDGTYNMIALGNIAGGENGKRFKMTIPGTGATQIDKLDIALINAGEQLSIEISGGTQTIKREDGTTLTTLTGNMSGWCGQSTNSSPFCSNIQYVE